jgi:hypothetical protein
MIYLFARDDGYAREIARFFEVALGPVQKQLEKLENGGVIYSKQVGRTRVYAFNPRYPFLKELKALGKSAYLLSRRDEGSIVDEQPQTETFW